MKNKKEKKDEDEDVENVKNTDEDLDKTEDEELFDKDNIASINHGSTHNNAFILLKSTYLIHL